MDSNKLTTPIELTKKKVYQKTNYLKKKKKKTQLVFSVVIHTTYTLRFRF